MEKNAYKIITTVITYGGSDEQKIKALGSLTLAQALAAYNEQKRAYREQSADVPIKKRDSFTRIELIKDDKVTLIMENLW